MKPENIQPHYFRPHRPHNCRRAKFHNYKAPGYYLITINKEPSVPEFSHIGGDIRSTDNPPHTILTSIGEIINAEIENLSKTAMFYIPNHVIMPDHIHILWHVKEWLPRDLGYYVGLLKSRCTLNYRKSSQKADKPHTSGIFQPCSPCQNPGL